MPKMRTPIIKYMAALSAVLLAWSCTRDDSDATTGSQTPEGLPAQMQIAIDPGSLTKGTGLSGAQEKAVTSAQVLIFDRNGKIVTNKYFSAVSVAAGIQSVLTRSGTNMSVYVVTNITAINSNYGSLFANVQTIADMNAIRVYAIGSDVETNKQLMMWGVATGVTIPPSPQSATVPVALSYVACKVHVHMVENTPSGEHVSWVDWQVQNLSRFSYLIPQAADAVSPANASDYVAATATYAWTDTTFTVSGIRKPGKYTVFYLFENRRGGRVANGATPPAGYTPGAIGTTDPRDKSWYAPSRATALVANGYYTTAGAVKGIKATLYFGANSYNDYNVERGRDYTYTVTVNGINQIDVDSRVDGNSSGFQADVLNPTLDCHYDWRPLRLGSYAGTLSVQILDGATGLAPASPSTFWLKVSSINLNQFVNNGSGTYVRPTYNPATDMVTSVGSIPFTDASQITFKTYYLYADEFLTEGGTRTAQVKITSSLAGSSPVVLTITQKGCQTMGTVGLRKYNLLGVLLGGSDYKLAVENQEEATMALTPGASTGSERTSTMQWGFSGQDMQSVLPAAVLDYYKRNGYENTQSLVISNEGTGALRTPYGRSGAATISEQANNPIFNTYAARYCFEKNRDVDGDGKIVGSEIKWYLPSIDELMLMWVGEPSLSQLSGEKISANPYFSSSEYSTATDALGAAFASGRTGYAPKLTELYVRCVRKL